jgi:hypothetical protein
LSVAGARDHRQAGGQAGRSRQIRQELADVGSGLEQLGEVRGIEPGMGHELGRPRARAHVDQAERVRCGERGGVPTGEPVHEKAVHVAHARRASAELRLARKQRQEFVKRRRDAGRLAREREQARFAELGNRARDLLGAARVHPHHGRAQRVACAIDQHERLALVRNRQRAHLSRPWAERRRALGERPERRLPPGLGVLLPRVRRRVLQRIAAASFGDGPAVLVPGDDLGGGGARVDAED